MQLSSKQKEMIAHFLRRQDEMFVDLRGEKRAQALSQIKQRIRKELLGLGVDSVTDLHVASLLNRMKVSVKLKKKSEVIVESEPEPKPEPEPAPEAKPGLESMGKIQEPPEAAGDVAPAVDETLKVAARAWNAEETASCAAASEEQEASEAVEGREELEDPPAEAGPKTVVEIEEDDDEEEDFGDRHWLGVCDNMAGGTGRSLGMIRMGFVVLGCLTGPVAILIYLAAYASGIQRHPRDYPAVDGGRVRGALFRLLGIAGGMFAVSWAIEFGAARGFLEYFGQLPEMGVWGRMSSYGAGLLVLVLVILSPLAALGALPLAYRWGATFSTIVNAGLAIYAVLISMGVASTMVGYALGALTQLAG